MRALTIGSMYPPHHVGGYETLWRSTNAGLRAAGHEIRVLTTDHREPDAPDRAEDADVHRELRWYWRDHEFPRLGPRARLRLEHHNAAVLDRHLTEFRPEAVIWWAMGGMSLSLLERVHRNGLPAVGVVGDDWMVYGPSVDGWLRLWRRAPRLGERLTGMPCRWQPGPGPWVFISEAIRRAARQAHVGLQRAIVAHPGVEDRFRPVRAAPWEGRLLYCGRIDPRKGIATAVEALARLPAQARLTIDGGGDGRHARELEELARRLGVAGRVHFGRSAAADVPQAYARADAVVFPVTWAEPWGLVPLEAMAVGRPVVATGVGGSGEYLEHGRNCLLFDPGDPGSLAEAVERLAGDADLRHQLVRGGRETAQRHTASAFVAAVDQALRAA